VNCTFPALCVTLSGPQVWGFFILQESSNYYCPPAKPGVYLEEIKP